MPQPTFSATALSTRKVLRMFRHQLAPELERILPGRNGQLIHEAFEIDGVLIDVHAAPEPRRNVRVAHRVVDQQVRDRVANRALPPAGVETLERRGIHAVLTSASGRTAARIDWPEMRMCSAGQIVVGIERAGQLALRDRVVAAVRACPLRATTAA